MKLNVTTCHTNGKCKQDARSTVTCPRGMQRIQMHGVHEIPGCTKYPGARKIWNVLLLLGMMLLMACNPGSKKEDWTYFHDYGEVFTTNYSIKYAYSHSLQEEIEAAFQAFNLSLNPFEENSIISK